jgi:hypothetical protein
LYQEEIPHRVLNEEAEVETEESSDDDYLGPSASSEEVTKKL